MLSTVVKLLEQDLESITDSTCARIVERIPSYATLEREVLRVNVTGLLGTLLAVLRDQDNAPMLQNLVTITSERVGQGIPVTDFLAALFATFPVFRESVRAAGNVDDPSLAEGFDRLEERMHEIGIAAAGIYADETARQLKAKNLELNRLTQRLDADKDRLSREVDHTSRALTSATEFNQRVLESLSAGIAVIEAGTAVVKLYSSRLEEILGIPTEEVLGKPVSEAFAKLKGVNVEAMADLVRTSGRLPMRRMTVTLPNGRTRTLVARADSLFDPEGSHESTVMVVDDASERELLIDSFSKYVSRDLLHAMLAKGELPSLDGQQKMCTVLFADIRGFTRMAEEMQPGKVHELVNSFFDVMVTGVEAHGGFVDKFIGDNVMSIFREGSPETAAHNALRAAGHIQHNLRSLAKMKTGVPAFEAGIGINTGEVLLGNVGSARRMQFTAMGDAVNVAARLQGLAAGAEIICGRKTAELVGDKVVLENLGEIQLKGRDGPVERWRMDWQAS